MWLIPSPACRFAPASGCSTKESERPAPTSDSATGFWVTLSGTPSRRPASWRGWKNRPWNGLLFGAETSPIWTPGLCGDSLTFSTPASPASPTALPASSVATTTNGATAAATAPSRTSCESWESVAPPWCSLKTSLPGLLEDGFDLSERNYQDWVTRSKARSLSLRNRLARAIGGSGCSSWPTPDCNTATYSNGHMGENIREAASQWPTPCGVSGNHGPDKNEFSTAVRKWPSPRAEDSESCGNHPEATDSLSGAVKNLTLTSHGDGPMKSSGEHGGQSITQPELWPTPAASVAQDGESPETWLARREQLKVTADNGNGCGTPLTMASRLWQTPQLPNGGGKVRGGSRSNEPLLEGQVCQWATPNAHERTQSPREVDHGIQLANQVDCWPTPNARDHKGTDLESRSGGTSLGHAAQTGEFSHRDREATGAESPKRSTRRLNPAFVCWLMGVPWFWTRAEPISCGAEATAAYRSLLLSRLSSLLGEF